MEGTALEKLCDILIEQILPSTALLSGKKFSGDMVLAYNKNAITAIKNLRKNLVNEPKAKPVKNEPKAKPVCEPKPSKKSRKEIEQGSEYQKLVQRVEKFKEDKLQQQMENENDELVGKLKALK